MPILASFKLFYCNFLGELAALFQRLNLAGEEVEVEIGIKKDVEDPLDLLGT